MTTQLPNDEILRVAMQLGSEYFNMDEIKDQVFDALKEHPLSEFDTDIEQTREKIQNERDGNNDPDVIAEYEEEVRHLEEEKQKFTTILEQLRVKGYQWSYFGFADINSPLYKAFMGELTLSPETFENAVSSSLEAYQKVFEALQKAKYRYDPNVNRADQAKSKDWAYTQLLLAGDNDHYGWDKKELQQAIANSGLAVPMRPWKVTNGKQGTTYNIERGIPLSAIGVTSERHPGQENTIYLPGIFSVHAYLPRRYYETLYRTIFNTLQYVDWHAVCEEGDLSPGIIRYIATNDFGIPLADVEHAEYDDICAMLERESQRRAQ